mgnify:FL=1
MEMEIALWIIVVLGGVLTTTAGIAALVLRKNHE